MGFHNINFIIIVTRDLLVSCLLAIFFDVVSCVCNSFDERSQCRIDDEALKASTCSGALAALVFLELNWSLGLLSKVGSISLRTFMTEVTPVDSKDFLETFDGVPFVASGLPAVAEIHSARHRAGSWLAILGYCRGG